MMRADLFDCINSMLRRHGPQPGQPFGGVRIALFGDPYQLAPVVSRNEAALMDGYETPFFWSADCYQEAGFEAIELTKPFRQSDSTFIGVLNAVREGTAAQSDLDVLNVRVQPKVTDEQIEADGPMLCTHNAQADQVNNSILRSLPGQAQVYRAKIEGNFPKDRFPTAEELYLKVGARVMLLNNTERWVNGTLVTVTAMYADHVDVELPNGNRGEVYNNKWDQYRYVSRRDGLGKETEGSYTQLPVKLGWACTIHKSQGLTF